MAKKRNRQNRRHTAPEKRSWRPGHKWRLALFVLLVSGLVAGGVHYVADTGAFPIRTVRVDGRFRNLQPEQIEQLVVGKVDGGFFTLDVEALRALVLTEPWVRSSAVQRSWPDTVRISVFEQEPVARWGKRSLLNDEGQVFTPAFVGETSKLVALDGPDGTEGRVLDSYREFRSMLRPLQLDVSSVVLNERRAWEVTLDNGLQLVLGHTDERLRLRRFIEAYDEVFSGRVAQVESIDLRYTNGFAVRWQQAQGNKG